MTRSQLIHPFLANPKKAEKFRQEKLALLRMQHILMDRLLAIGSNAAAVSKLTTATGPVASCLDEPNNEAIATGKNEAYKP